MAASSWGIFAVYTDDPAAALREVQDRVFAAGSYRLPGNDVRDADARVLNQISPDVSKLKQMLKIAKALDKAFADIGADTSEAEKNTADVEAFIGRMEKDGFAAAAKSVVGGSSAQAPDTIDALREMAAEAGTHSILDIERIADEPATGAAAPLSESQLAALFGTTQPTAPMVQKAQATGAISTLCERWQAVYFPVFAGEAPTHYFFAGVSGD